MGIIMYNRIYSILIKTGYHLKNYPVVIQKGKYEYSCSRSKTFIKEISY